VFNSPDDYCLPHGTRGHRHEHEQNPAEPHDADHQGMSVFAHPGFDSPRLRVSRAGFAARTQPSGLSALKRLETVPPAWPNSVSR
jgi:hypothetical protein